MRVSACGQPLGQVVGNILASNQAVSPLVVRRQPSTLQDLLHGRQLL